MEDYIKEIAELFLVYGPRGCSMDDIAKNLRVSKKTLYEHFKNKDELVQKVSTYTQGNICAYFENKTSNYNPIEKILFAKNIFMKSMSKANPLFIRDIQKYHPAVYESVNLSYERQWNNFISESLIKGIKEGLFREDIDVNIETYIFVNQMVFLKKTLTKDSIEYPKTTILDSIIYNFIRAMATSKGIETLEINKNK